MKYYFLSASLILVCHTLLSMDDMNYDKNQAFIKLEQAVSENEYEIQKENIDMQAVDLIISSGPQQLKDLIMKYEDKDAYPLNTLPKIILLIGEPGVGKSTLAQGIAIKAKTYYTFVKCSSLANEFKNSGIQNINRIFKPFLQSKAPQVIILDEINTITDKHANKQDSDKNMSEALWQNLDELEKSKQFKLIIATTNSSKKIPKPLKSRIAAGQAFKIEQPDYNVRKKITKHYLDKFGYSYSPIIVNVITSNTKYESGRSIKSICSKTVSAAILRARKTSKPVSIEALDVYAALAIHRETLDIVHYKKYSPLYTKIKKLMTSSGPYILPTVSLFMNAYSMQKQLSYSEQNLEIAKQGLDIAKKTYENQPDKWWIKGGTTASTVIAVAGLAIATGKCTIL